MERYRFSLAHPVRLRYQLPHHLSRLHHRARGVAGDPRGDAARDRQPGLSARFRLLAEGFAVSFGMGVVTGIVMAFQFGTNWSVLAERPARSRGRCSAMRRFTAFLLEATFFGVMLLGRDRVPPWFYFLSCCMVSLGHHAVVVLDPGQQQLDAGAAGPRHRGRQIRPRRLVRDRARAHDAGALAAHAAGRLPDHRHVRQRHRRLVSCCEGVHRPRPASCCTGASAWSQC